MGSCIHATDWVCTRAVTRMSLAAMIHALLHGPDTFFPKSFCAARSAGMSLIPCSDMLHISECIIHYFGTWCNRDDIPPFTVMHHWQIDNLLKYT